jgi:hypothetical protein
MGSPAHRTPGLAGGRRLPCLRCRTVELSALPSPPGSAFFRCPNCGRDFTRTASGALVFRWGHPISRLLYPVIFDEHPVRRCAEVSAEFAAQHEPEAVRLAIDEILLELSDPSQPIAAIVGCRAPEAELREFLRCVAERLEAQAR